MIEIVGDKPQKTCAACGTTFRYDVSDVRVDSEQYWAGFWEGGWLHRAVRYIRCPGCGKTIRL